MHNEFQRLKITLFLLFCSGLVLAQAPSNYYTGVDGKRQSALKTAFFSVIKDPSVTSYDGLWTSFKTTDKKANGRVWDMYSDKPGETPPYEYTFGSSQCGNYSGEGSCYNREHSFPKSWFGDVKPMNCDLFHLYPTDGYVNGKRGNDAFGEVGIAKWTSQNGSKSGQNTTSGYTGNVFEPIDEYKGDFARTYFYMATCYEDKIGNWGADMLAGNSYPAYKTWAVDLLLKWSRQDPVSQKEIDRNNAVYAIQKNRNPFIDFPGLEEYIWGTKQSEGFDPNNQGGTTDPRLVFNPASLSFSSNVPNAMSSQTINVKGYNLEGNLSVSISGDNVFTTSTTEITQSSAESSTGYTITVNFKPTAYGSNSAVLTISGGGLAAPQSVNLAGVTAVQSETIELLNTTFKSTLSPFFEYNVIGSQKWAVNSSYGAVVSGYVSNANLANEAWLISPANDLTGITGAELNFSHTMNKGNVSNLKTNHTLWFSENYTSGLPSTAIWNQVQIPTYPAGTNWTFVESGAIEVPSVYLNKNNIRFAFKYLCSTSESATWEITSLKLVAKKTGGGLGVGDTETDENNLYVYARDGKIEITANDIIGEVWVYNIFGQLITKIKTSENHYSIPVSNGQMYLVKSAKTTTKVFVQ